MVQERIPAPTCPCGHVFVLNRPETLIARRPEDHNADVLSPSFEMYRCPRCGTQHPIAQPFILYDSSLGWFLEVRLESSRAQWMETELALAAKLAKMGMNGENAPPIDARLVFGHAELREKLLLRFLGLDDRWIEAWKLEEARRRMPDLGEGEILRVTHFHPTRGRLLLQATSRPSSQSPPPVLELSFQDFSCWRKKREEVKENWPELFDQLYVNAARYLLDFEDQQTIQ